MLKKICAFLLAVAMVLPFCPIVLAEKKAPLTDTELTPEQEVPLKSNEAFGGSQNKFAFYGLEEEDTLPDDYDQNVIDNINNNIVMNNQQSKEPAPQMPETSLVTEEHLKSIEAYDTGIPEEFKIDTVESPYLISNSSSESVSLSTGSMTYQKNLLSLPGRNGLDLDISIRYDSDKAVIAKSEFDENNNGRDINFNNFAAGWSFNFPTINKGRSEYCYQYKAETTLQLTDGSTYEITGDREDISEDISLSLGRHFLNDISLKRIASTKEYLLTYLDGRKEYFDGTYGNIKRIEDRYGNSIVFEYELMDYFRGTFSDYKTIPSYYNAKANVLSKITDSSGRIIDIDYHFIYYESGPLISNINIKMDNTNYATLSFDVLKTYNGETAILKSVSDAEQRKTIFTHSEQLAYLYTKLKDYYNETYVVNGSVITLDKVKYPTGGESTYKYEKARRSYYSNKPYQVIYGWYNVYKIAEMRDMTGALTQYSYENDYSGYPYSRIDSENDSSGHIEKSDITYSTYAISNKSDQTKVTVSTFDYQHHKINDIVYDGDDSIYGYSKAKGGTEHSVFVNNKLYRVDINDNNLYMYYQKNTGSNTPWDFSRAYKLNSDKYNKIQDVKSCENKIYVFLNETVSEYDKNGNIIVLVFDTSRRTWTKENDSISNEYTKGTYYSDGKFILLGAYPNPGKCLIYNTLSQSAKTTIYTMPGIFICADAGNAYFRNGSTIYQYNMQTHGVNSKQFLSLTSEGEYGFSVNGKTFLCTRSNSNDIVREFNYETGILGEEIEMPFGTKTYPGIWAGCTDGYMYHFRNSQNSSRDFGNIYRLDLNAENGWSLIATRMFKVDQFEVLSASYVFYMGLYDKTKADREYLMMDKLCGGYELLWPARKDRQYIKTEYQYNAYDQVIEQKLTLFDGASSKPGGVERWSYVDKKNLISEYTDVLDNVTKYEYDPTYYLPIKIIQYANLEAEGKAIITENTLETDYRRSIVSTTKHFSNRDIISVYTYSTTHPGNIISQTDSEKKGNVTTVLNVLQYEYDATGTQVTKEKIKNVNSNNAAFEMNMLQDLVTSYTYNQLGLVQTTTDANGKTTTYNYNKNGWVTKITNPDQTTIEKTYVNKEYGSEIITSYNGQYKTVDSFDSLGRISKQSDRPTETTERIIRSYSYSYALPQTIKDANNKYVQYGYDSYDRIIFKGEYDNDYSISKEESVEYDDYNLSKKVYAGDKYTTSYYDKAGRLKNVKTPTAAGISETIYEYDYMGNVSKIIDANGGVTQNGYNDEGQLLSVTNALGQTTSYEYDLRGNASKVTTPGGSVTQTEFDTLSRPVKTIDAVGGSTYFAYDNIGNVIGSKDKKGQITSLTYDDMNRMTSKITGEMSLRYTYDTLGNVLTMTDMTGTATYTYKYNNLLESITTADGKTITYSYDNAGNVIGVNDYAGQSFSYTYDGSNRLAQIRKGSSAVASYEYNLDGSLKKEENPEGTTEYTYDDALQLLSMTNKLSNSSVISAYSYEYDIIGNQTKKTETENENIKITSYTYDAISRLTDITEPDGTATGYIFDANNNIITRNVKHPSEYEYQFKQNGIDYTMSNLSMHNITYAYNMNNQLLEEREYVGGTGTDYSGFIEAVKQYTYDENGNTLRMEKGGQVDSEVVEYEYNLWNQLVEYKDENAVQTLYSYDGTGMRVSKTQSGATTRFYWDRGYISNEADADGFTVANYIGVNGIFGRESSDNISYMFKNGHGDVTALVSGGAVAKRYDYDAYGVEKNPDPNDSNPFRYCAEYFDQESSNIYLRNRYYNPAIPRFITPDTHWNTSNMIFGDSGGTTPDIAAIMQAGNLYTYCMNSPIMWFDFLGLFSTRDTLARGKNNNINDVKKLQNELKWLKLYDGEVDGSFGPNTEKAVMKFQEKAGLTVDGVVGKNTWQALGLKFEAIIFYSRVFTISWEDNYTIYAEIFYSTDEAGNLLSVRETPLEYSITNNICNLGYDITFISAYRHSDSELGINVRVKESLGVGVPGEFGFSLPIELRTIDINTIFSKGEYFK